MEGWRPCLSYPSPSYAIIVITVIIIVIIIIAIIIIIFIIIIIIRVKQVWLADDSAGGGRIAQLYDWYKQLSKEREKFGYLVNGSKC